MRRREFTLDVRSANETGNPTNVQDLVDLVVEIGPASFTATVQLQAQVIAGGPWAALGSAFTDAGGRLEISSAFYAIRAATSGYSAGALTGVGAGRDSRTE